MTCQIAGRKLIRAIAACRQSSYLQASLPLEHNPRVSSRRKRSKDELLLIFGSIASCSARTIPCWLLSSEARLRLRCTFTVPESFEETRTDGDSRTWDNTTDKIWDTINKGVSFGSVADVGLDRS